MEQANKEVKKIDVYLASPYSHPDEKKRAYRYRVVCTAAASLMKDYGYTVFSPIAHSHGIGLEMNNANDHQSWVEQDLVFMPFCENFVILTLPGWEMSEGIKQEAIAARRLGLKFYLLPLDLPIVYHRPLIEVPDWMLSGLLSPPTADVIASSSDGQPEPAIGESGDASQCEHTHSRMGDMFCEHGEVA